MSCTVGNGVDTKDIVNESVGLPSIGGGEGGIWNGVEEPGEAGEDG